MRPPMFLMNVTRPSDGLPASCARHKRWASDSGTCLPGDRVLNEDSLNEIFRGFIDVRRTPGEQLLVNLGSASGRSVAVRAD